MNKKTIIFTYCFIGVIGTIFVFIIFAPRNMTKRVITFPTSAYCGLAGGSYEQNYSSTDDMGIKIDTSSCEVKEKLANGEEVNYFDPFSSEPIWNNQTLCECSYSKCWNGYKCIDISN